MEWLHKPTSAVYTLANRSYVNVQSLQYITLFFLGMAYNFQKYSLDRIQYLGAPYDTGES